MANENQYITEAKKDLVQWNSRYEIGIPKIDAQHKHLIELCNSLHDSVLVSDRNKQKEQLTKVLKQCVSYVKEHFTLEEGLMQQSQYPDFQEHKQGHSRFCKEVLDTAKEIEAKSMTNALKFVKFLHDWILQHISYEDKKYVSCVKEYLAKQKQ